MYHIIVFFLVVVLGALNFEFDLESIELRVELNVNVEVKVEFKLECRILFHPYYYHQLSIENGELRQMK